MWIKVVLTSALIKKAFIYLFERHKDTGRIRDLQFTDALLIACSSWDQAKLKPGVQHSGSPLWVAETQVLEPPRMHISRNQSEKWS